MEKFTKGPWTIGHNALGMHGISTKNLETQIVPGIYVGTEEKEANAHLIAAAPELYEALKMVDRKICKVLDSRIHYEASVELRECLDNIEKGLAKARGDQ